MKTYDFSEQLKIGAQGVEAVKTYLESKGVKVLDYQGDMKMQRRGIDLHAEGYGVLEVKTDTHRPTRVWLEVDVGGQPGCIFRSRADYLVTCWLKHKVAAVYKLPELQLWLMLNWQGLFIAGAVRAVFSSHKGKKWFSTGVPVPRRDLEAGLTYVKEWKLP